MRLLCTNGEHISTSSGFNFPSRQCPPLCEARSRGGHARDTERSGGPCRRRWSRILESPPMELIPKKQNQTEGEREQQSPGSWQPSTWHTLTSGFSLKPCGTRHNKSLSLVSAATPRWCFITKDTFGWKNSAEVVLVKTLGSTYPESRTQKG